MWSIIMEIIGTAYLACVGWFNQFTLRVPGFLATWIIIFTIYTLVRLVLMPIIGKGINETNISLYKELKNKEE